jgi:hypothetical protein
MGLEVIVLIVHAYLVQQFLHLLTNCPKNCYIFATYTKIQNLIALDVRLPLQKTAPSTTKTNLSDRFNRQMLHFAFG